jgi:hypothetical protein
MTLATRINYKSFIEENFQIIDKTGKVVPFIFNDTQNYYWNLLIKTYPTLSNVRENILKFRQPGFSSLIDAMFTVDFIMSESGQQSITFSDIYSHKDEETRTLFQRVDTFIDSFCEKNKTPGTSKEEFRKSMLVLDSGNKIQGHRKSEINVRTANAKVSGRGGTKQNIHWSEPAFYPNTEILNANDLVIGAEQQVADGVGKIFRESTGNMIGDFFNEEYEFGKKPEAKFKSRFLGWWLHQEYSLTPASGWSPDEKYKKLIKIHGASLEQCYWHYNKVNSAKPSDREKVMREYPCDDIEAFMQQGKLYFNVGSLKHYKDILKKSPINERLIYV